MSTPSSSSGSASKGKGRATSDGVRVSQRAPTSCSFCTRRKIRCEKVIPCSNCIARGLSDECSREAVVVKGRLRGGEQEKDKRAAMTYEDLRKENLALRKKLLAREKLLLQHKVGFDQTATVKTEDARFNDGGMDIGSSRAMREAQNSIIVETASGEAPFAASDHYSLGLPHSPLSDGRRIGTSESFGIAGRLGSTDSALAIHAKLMPPSDQSRFLIRAAFKFTHWVHGAVHRPTFMHELEHWLGELDAGREVVKSEGWFAIYFAFLSIGLYFIDVDDANKGGFYQNDIDTLPPRWFEASMEAIYRSDFLAHPTLQVLQALTILPLIAHSFGASAAFASLLHCGLRMSQSLRLHLLTPEVYNGIPKPGTINRELGRRIWACLRVAEVLSPMGLETYALLYPESRTAPPANIDDEDLSDTLPVEPKPLHEVTVATEVVAMYKLAVLKHAHQVKISQARSEAEHWNTILETDAKMTTLLDFCPALQATDEPYPTSCKLDDDNFDYTPWARHTWATMLPPSRIRLYSHFIGKSYVDSQYREARQVCIQEALHLLNERQRPIPDMWRKTWHFDVALILAGMVLATEYLHGDANDEVRAQLKREVLTTVELLGQYLNPQKPNVIPTRGRELLLRMVADHSPPHDGPASPSNGTDSNSPHVTQGSQVEEPIPAPLRPPPDLHDLWPNYRFSDNPVEGGVWPFFAPSDPYNPFADQHPFPSGHLNLLESLEYSGMSGGEFQPLRGGGDMLSAAEDQWWAL